MRFCCQFGMGPVEHYVPFAIAAEAAGFDGITCGDSFMYPKASEGIYPYTEDGDRSFIEAMPVFDPVVAMTAWAVVTDSVSIFPSVYKFPSRHPVQVAKMMSSLSVLSGERLKFGIGISPWEEDFTVFGLPFEGRAERLEEGVEIFRGLMKGDYFAYSGRFYNFPEIKLNPTPKTPIPIIIGGHAPPAMRRAARIADGWVSAPVTHDELKALVQQMRQHLRDAGRDGRGFEIHGFDTDLVDLSTARRAQAIGVTDAQVIPWLHLGAGATLQQKFDAIARFRDEVIVPFRDTATCH